MTYCIRFCYVALLLMGCLSTSAQYAAPLASSEKMEWSNWKEDVKQRSAFTATWSDGQGGVRMQTSSVPIHYALNGAWQKIDWTPAPTSDGFIARQQPFPTAIHNDGSASISLSPYEVMQWQCTRALGWEMSQTSPWYDVNVWEKARNAHDQVIERISFRNNALKSNYHIDQPHAISDHVIEWTFRLPQGARIQPNRAHGFEREEYWFGELMVEDQRGEVISTIGGTWAKDENHSMALAGYRWNDLGDGVFQVSASFDPEWLSAAVYPLDIDPLITGPVAAFGDNMMLSCYIPEYNVDSLLVTIPGQITVTAFVVTASFYADPFAFSIMSDGSMYFSTSCAQTQTFEVQPPTGDLAGTAYLENFDMRNPLLCCYAPQCSDTSFYLRMHLGRYTPAGDCNMTYVYYTPTTLWPFTAYIEGHTVETYGAEWSVTNTAICSNKCDVEGTARVKFGVPPYTLTHPWMQGEMVQESPTPCDISGKQIDVPMIWPGCPFYCPSPTPFTQDVPPPTIVDACGNVAEGIDAEVLNIKAAPSIEDPSPVVVCPNAEEVLTLTSCAPTFQIVWAGNGTTGQGPIPLNLENPTEGDYEYFYLAHVEWNGCKSDTIPFTVVVVSNPSGDFHVAPDPIMQNIPAYLIADTLQLADPVAEVWWTVDDASTLEGGIVETVLNELGWSEVCMILKSVEGCVDTTCKEIEVVTAAIEIPNIFTPNGDGLNESFEIRYLDFFPENHLEVYDRWGVKIYEEDNYHNNWSAQDAPDGVYYYILHVAYLGDYSGYVTVSR